jgi:hypothetical protein
MIELSMDAARALIKLGRTDLAKGILEENRDEEVIPE